MNSRFLRNGIVTLVLVVGTAALLYMFIFPDNKSETIPYSGSGSFLELVSKGEVSKVTQQRPDARDRADHARTRDEQAGHQDEPRPERAGDERPDRHHRRLPSAPQCTTAPQVVGARRRLTAASG